MGLKKRRITANDRNYSGGSFNLKRGAVAPLANTMAAIGEGEAPAPTRPGLLATKASSSRTVDQVKPSTTVGAASPHAEPGILRRISVGLVKLFSDKSLDASNSTAATTTSPTTAADQAAATSQQLCSVAEPANANEEGDGSVMATDDGRSRSGSLGKAIRRLSISMAHRIADAMSSADPSHPTTGTESPVRGRSMSVTETFVAMIHRGPVDRFGQGNVTTTGQDASFVDEGLHVLIDAAPDSTAFAQTLLDKVTDMMTAYTKSDDFLLCVNSQQVAGELKTRLGQAVAAVQTKPDATAADAAASVGVAVMHRHPKDNIARLHVLNIGNTKTIVVRRHEITFESSSLMLGFNRPLRVLSTTPSAAPATTTPSSPPTMLYDMYQLEAGDVVVSCTDGITNNLYANEIVETIQVVSKYRHSSWDWVAQEIAQVAVTRSDDPLNRQSPFAKEAAAELYRCIDHDPDLLGMYASLLRQDVNLTKTALFRNTNIRQGDDVSLDQLAQWARAIVGTTDDATVVISTV
ncbi:hypothetical protein H310_12784 [Aphanomyces invadans]|uniref:Protein phosphatase n=1 Tax=Aphanomyces invadans TaxID=157072 RepID=A0A024TGJ8_9STRA|nr:hypothetical protein H310_12784 [Aphanomyces invadans]ETV93178.1 hypothetical protein H310_12784 [Aphanomyces invadans]|eukprot:XP_008878200.1 hypothetical protein H310_12784 [Aphanomyces invadans]